MNSDDNRISPLDSRSRAKLVASVQISSLNEVIIELIKNALDAHARGIEVTLDYTTGFCCVADDGFGIPAGEFCKSGRLAQEYCTSKLATTKQIYGRYGQTLSRVAGVGLLCIISKASHNDGAHVLWCDEAGRIGNETRGNEDVRACIGTTVKVYNLFSKLPVRSRHIRQIFTDHHEVQKEFNRLKQLILGLILSNATPFEVDVKYTSSAIRYRHRPAAVRSLTPDVQSYQTSEAVCSGLRQAGFMREQRKSQWCQMRLRSGSTNGFAVISTVPLPHRDLQFISINNKALSKHTRPEVFAHVNSLFTASSFGSFEPGVGPDIDTAELASEIDHEGRVKQRTRSKRIDQWPMFVIWLEDDDDDNFSLCDILYARLLSRIEESLLDRITSFLEVMTSEFLLQNGFSSTSKLLRKHRTTSATTEGSFDKINYGIQGVVDQNFIYFSRLRSSAQTGNIEILDGLPFSNISTFKRFTPTVHLQEDILDINVTNEIDNNSSPLPWNENEEQSMLWLDPISGRHVKVDLRTGMVLPDFVCPGWEEPSEFAPSSPSQRQVVRCTKANTMDCNIAQTARNVHKYFDDRTKLHNSPIHSTMIRNHNAQNFGYGHQLRADQHEIFNQQLSPNERSLRITKEALMSAKVATQVDKKFILAVIPLENQVVNESEPEDDCLILVDQHAADERCKVERLLKSVQCGSLVHLEKPIRCEIPRTEFYQMLEIKYALDRLHFVVEESSMAKTGIAVNDESRQVEIKALPEAIAERCRLNPRLAIDILREIIWSERTRNFPTHDGRNIHAQGTSPVSIAQDLPPRMLDLINSRACRSAIMFNDGLNDIQCLDLIHELGRCTLPFHCAHGRPSMTVVADMQQVTDYGTLDLVTESKINDELSITNSGQPFSWLTQTHNCLGLNTIVSHSTPSFGDAYRFWMGGESY